MLTETTLFRRFPLLRTALASSLILAAGCFAFLSFAATPPSGTLTDTSGPITYTSGPFLVSNPTATAELDCVTLPCDDYGLTVNVPASFATTHNMVITTSWPNPGEDYDVYLRSGLPPGTTDIRDSASSSNPEVIVVDAVAGQYTVRIVPFAVAGGTTTTRIELRLKPSNPPPAPPSPGTPRFHNFPAPPSMGNNSGEPTLATGLARMGQPGGRTMYIAGLETLRVTWNDCSSPASSPGFADDNTVNPALIIPLWEDKSAPQTSVTTLDPILFGDMQTGRIFVSQLGPKTSFLALTDDDGETYLPSQGSPINPGVDHQTIGGGPYSPTLEPVHPLYPNASYYASQDIAVAQLGRSDDGGVTFGPAVPMYNLTQCGGLHGHVKVTPRSPLTETNGHLGTVYVPNKGCGGQQAVVVSENNGVNFAIRPIPGSVSGPSDPSVGIDKAGKIYVAMADGTGRPTVAFSADKGVTWSTPQDVGIPFSLRNSVFPTAVGGDEGRATVMYLATDTPGNFQATGVFTGVWHIYAASTFDGGNTWATVRVTPENDPVQRGSICAGGTTCGGDRNLLDFNDMEIDQEGRIIMSYADGCIGCTSPTGADSRSEKATIARQSGGRRMLLTASSPQEDNNAIVPAAPLVTTVARTNATTVHVEWATPDNGGAAITGYNVFRKTGAGGTYARLGGTPTTGATRTSYDDTTATDTTAEYFYKVTALNSVGEGTNCGDFNVGALVAPPSPCTVPGIQILTDQAGDIITPIGQSANPGFDLRSLSIAEPFGFIPDKLVFTLKVEDLTVVPPDTRYPIQFTVNGNGYFVDMSTYPSDGGSPAAPVFKYGTFNPTGGTGGIYGAPNTRLGNADAESTFTPDGNIRIVISRDKIGNPAVGENLTGFLVRVRFGSDVLSVTPDNMPQDLGPTGSYTVVGNASCAPNAAPVAVLNASPTSGVAPVTVNFNASGSFDPDAGDTIVSYTFNFGDGSPQVTQASPTISHTYADSGNYQASVMVTDSRGAMSDSASSVIEVGTTLTGVVSRKTHTGQGDFDIDLTSNGGTTAVECRNDGSNSHKVIFTFQRNLTTVTSSTVAEGMATKGSEGVGPNPNQYTVNLTGVANAQNVTVRLDGVQDSAGANETDVRGRVAILNGDVSGNRSTNSTDVSQVKAISGQPFDPANFRADVNVNGSINSSDVSQIKSNSGTSVPSSPVETKAVAARSEKR